MHRGRGAGHSLGKSGGTRGLNQHYWARFVARLRETAILCSYGYQDFYRVLGRDPVKQPMSHVERAVFARLILECFEAKTAPGAAMAAMTGRSPDADG